MKAIRVNGSKFYYTSSADKSRFFVYDMTKLLPLFQKDVSNFTVKDVINAVREHLEKSKSQKSIFSFSYFN